MTHKKAIIIIFTLTTIMALYARYAFGWSYFVTTILALSATKFILVAFQFMELKKANSFWRFFIIFYLFIFVGVISLVVK